MMIYPEQIINTLGDPVSQRHPDEDQGIIRHLWVNEGKTSSISRRQAVLHVLP